MKKIFDLIYTGKIDLITEMLNSENIVNVQEKHGRTPLMEAVIENKTEIVELLLTKGADANLQDSNGFTALHFAAQNNNDGIARVLLESGVNVDIQDVHGNTPLFRAVYNSDEKGEIIKLIVSFGADKNIKNKYGVSPKILAETIGDIDVEKFLV